MTSFTTSSLVFLAVATAGCAVIWSCSRAMHGMLSLAQLERKERITAIDTREYQNLESRLSDGAYLQANARFRTLFRTLTSPHASLSENALAVYRAGVEARPAVQEVELDDAHSLLVDWYFGPVHAMNQLNFNNNGAESAFGSGLVDAPTLLYLIMWHIAQSDDAGCLAGYLARYNRDVKMARMCGTQSTQKATETMMIGADEAAALFDKIEHMRSA